MRSYVALFLATSSIILSARVQHVVSPEMKAETIVKRAVKILHRKGLDALNAEVKKPDGHLRIDSPSPDPRLTVYSATFTVLSESPIGSSENAVRVEDPSLPKMSAFVQEKGPGWFEFDFKDASGNAKGYQSYVVLHDGVLITATIERRR